MGQFYTKVEHVFFNDCQKQLSKLDNTLLSLALSIDSLHNNVNLLQCELEQTAFAKDDGTKSTGVDLEKNIQLTKDLLCTIEGSLYHQKMSVLQDVGQLKQVIKDACKTKKDSLLLTIPALRNASIDNYIEDFQGKERQQLSSKTSDAGSETSGTHDEQAGDVDKIQSLRKDIELLRSEKDSQMEEKQKMEKKLQHLLKLNSELKENNAMLQNERPDPNIVPVQMYYQHGGDQMASVVHDIMSMLNTQPQFGDRKLGFITCKSTADIHSGIPLLALCINTSRLGTDAELAIQGIKQLKKTALVIFHHKDEHALPNQDSNRVLTKEEFKQLGGIFDMAFLSGRGIYHCEKNTEATGNIATFIEKH